MKAKLISILPFLIMFCVLFIGCKGKESKGLKQNFINTETFDSKPIVDLELDHFFIWVENPETVKESLTKIGFNILADSISTIHEGQGTAGKYFFFWNCYLELLYVYDKQEIETNKKLNDSLGLFFKPDLISKGASPFGIGLYMKNYQPERIPFRTFKYHQKWMGSDEMNLFVSKTSFELPKEPEVFIVFPEIQTWNFSSIDEIDDKFSEETHFKRDLFNHPNNAKKVTKIVIETTIEEPFSETMKIVNGIQHIEIKKGRENLMKIYFDNQRQGKSFDLRPKLPLIVYL